MNTQTRAEYLQSETDRLFACRIKAHNNNDKILNTIVYLLSAEAVCDTLHPDPDDTDQNQATDQKALVNALRSLSRKFQNNQSEKVPAPLNLRPSDIVAAWAGMRASFLQQDGTDLPDLQIDKNRSSQEAAMILKVWIPHAIAFAHNLALNDQHLKKLPERETRFAATLMATWDGIAVVLGEHPKLNLGSFIQILRSMPDETLTFIEKVALGLTASEKLFFSYHDEMTISSLFPEIKQSPLVSNHSLL